MFFSFLVIMSFSILSHLFAQDNKTENISDDADTRHNHSGHPGDPEAHVLDRIMKIDICILYWCQIFQ